MDDGETREGNDLELASHNSGGMWVSRGMAWPAVGVVGGGEASTASQPARGGRSMRHDRRYFGRLEQEDQRLKLEYPRLKKKHDIRWIDIQWPLLLEPCVDYNKLAKPCIRVNLLF